MHVCAGSIWEQYFVSPSVCTVSEVCCSLIPCARDETAFFGVNSHKFVLSHACVRWLYMGTMFCISKGKYLQATMIDNIILTSYQQIDK